MSADAAPTLDEGVLVALAESVGGDDAFVAELVGTYLADGASQVEAIRAATAAGDTAAVVRPAHTLKSASYTVGAMRLGDLARQLEVRGRESAAGTVAGDSADVVADAQLVRGEWARADAALRAWLEAHR